MAAPSPIPITMKAGWYPDLPDFGNPGATVALNVLPRTAKSFGPVRTPSVYSGTALSARCQGAAAYLDTGGNVTNFAGDVSKLYKYDATSASFTDVSKGGGYACPTNGRWVYEYFNGSVVATDFTDAIQSYALASSALFADLAGTPPRARYMAAVRGFLALANTFDGTSGNAPQRVWWSAVGDCTSWPTPGSVAAAQVMSGYNDLTGSGGWNQGIVGNLGNADGAVIQEHAVYRMMFAGPPNVFDFLPVQGAKGTAAPASIVQIGPWMFYFGEDGFYRFDGTASVPIGVDKLDQTILADVDQGNLQRVCAAVDPVHKMVLWGIPGTGNSGGNPNYLLAYRWDLEEWTKLSITVETMARLLSVGYTLDQLYTVLGYTLDTLPAPLDDRIWTGGNATLGLFDANHKLNYLTGTPMAATIESGEAQPFPGQRAAVGTARPWVDGGTPSIALGYRDRMPDTVSYTAASAMNAFGQCPLRQTGRYVRARLTIPAGSSWTNAMGMELDAQPRGLR